ncbi:MAG: Ig domain-containing protein [Lachnospiraceae bacterium]|nr:Ig domain-containing protein [Lachnospiraceae bacterium]
MKRKMFNKLMALLMAGAMTLSSAPVTAQAVYAREVTEDSIIADENAEDAAAGEGDMIDLTEDKENVGETGLIDFSEEEETVGETGPTDLIQTEAAVGEKGEDGLTEIAASEEEALVEEMLGDGIDGSYYALVNIPYAEFYAAEGDDDVDAVSSSTKAKPRATNLAGGSYHVSETGEDITGITYPVKLSSEYLFDLAMMVNSGEITVITDEDSKSYTIRLRGQEVPVTLTGKEVLFESPTYSFYVLGAEPASYKELTVDESGAFAFDKATGEADTVEGLTGNVKLNARHANVEITLNGVEIPAAGEGEDPIYVSGVVVTDENGSMYALRHVAELWRNTQIGWNYDDARLGALTGTTITNIRYYLNNGTITDYPCEIAYKIAKYNESAANPALIQADDQTAEQLATYLGAIETVTVNGTEYNNKETPVIATADVKDENGNVTALAGTIDLNVESDGKKIFDGGEYELTVKAAAHDDYTFKLVAPTITMGGDQEIGIDLLETDQVGLTTDGNPAYLLAVKVDGKTLSAPADYEAMGPNDNLSVLFTKEFQKTLKIGEHKIEVVYANGTDTTKLTVKAISVTGVKLNKTSAKLLKGKTLQLKATVTPAKATDRTVTWKSSNSAVAAVDKTGKVTAKKTGTAKITVTTKDGKKTAVCTITVYERVPLYRFYNRKTGDHMYTISETERKALIKAGWKLEGIACHVPKTSSKPVYRLYNKSNGDHMFTISNNERKAMISAG